MAFEKYILPESGVAKMPVHAFVGILSENLQGEKTGAECKTAIEDYLGVTLTTDETTDITDTLSYIQAGSDLANKSRRMDEVYRACILAETGIWYTTQALLRSRLSWSTP